MKVQGKWVIFWIWLGCVCLFVHFDLKNKKERAELVAPVVTKRNDVELKINSVLVLKHKCDEKIKSIKDNIASSEKEIADIDSELGKLKKGIVLNKTRIKAKNELQLKKKKFINDIENLKNQQLEMEIQKNLICDLEDNLEEWKGRAWDILKETQTERRFTEENIKLLNSVNNDYEAVCKNYEEQFVKINLDGKKTESAAETKPESKK